jgi:hypothetical protein
MDDFVIYELRRFNKLAVLKRLKEKADYYSAINYKAYKIAGKVIGRTAEEWMK